MIQMRDSLDTKINTIKQMQCVKLYKYSEISIARRTVFWCITCRYSVQLCVNFTPIVLMPMAPSNCEQPPPNHVQSDTADSGVSSGSTYALQGARSGKGAAIV